MESHAIQLDMATYSSIKKAIKNGEDELVLRSANDILILNIKNNNSDDDSNKNKKNIVAEWMKNIQDYAEEAINSEDESESKIYMKNIISYANAVITTVSSI